jgi:formylglycine-generating enzyme required for sulfatase activity
LRGGDWNHYANVARCADRYIGYPGNVNYNIGFRCVRGL